MAATGLIVCMPTRGAVSIETMLCLREHLDGYPNKLLTVFRKPVVEARNELAKQVRELDDTTLDFDPRYVLMVDDDAHWLPGTVDRAVKVLEDNPDVAMMIGAYCARAPHWPPLAMVTNGEKLRVVNFLRHEPGTLIDVDVCGLHWNLVRRELLTQLGDEPFNRLPATELLPKSPPGVLLREDESFCRRVLKIGRVVVDRSLRVGHVDVTTGKAYYPNFPTMKANGAAPFLKCDEKDETAATFTERTYFEPNPEALPSQSDTKSVIRPRGSKELRKFVESALSVSTIKDLAESPELYALSLESLSPLEVAAGLMEKL
jgi:hypothetical protein